MIASFKRGDMISRAIYDMKGNFKFSVVNYYEKELPHEILAEVNKQYKNYRINLVQDITSPQTMARIIHIEDDKNLKNLLIRDGEISVYQEYKKADKL